jgi:3-oxoacyl-[acyl-carrier protein] reductase
MGILKGEVSLVTGASLGIGRATAERLASEGSQIILNYYSPHDKKYGKTEAVNKARDSLRKYGVKVLPYEADVSDRHSVLEMVKEAESKFGHIDILVNNAGAIIPGFQDFGETTEEAFDRMLGVNLKGQFFAAQAVVPGMVKRRHGKIVNVSSEIALIGEPRAVAYSASKAGIIGFTKALAKELGPHGITVNCLCPGPTETDDLTPYERSEEYLKRIPLRRLGRPEEVAGSILFLVSPDSMWTTGQVFSPNGGIVI